jgi:hypothetical protein
VYDTVHRSFAPVAALFQYDRDIWKQGETFTCGLWAVNDQWEPVPGATLRWAIRNASGATVRGGSIAAPLPADSSERLGTAQWAAGDPGAYQLHAEILDSAGRTISENVYEFEVRKP